mgnify:CR=1 FL=1
MPGYVFSTSAFFCKTGSKLHKVKGSVCESCYALNGNYRYPAVMEGMALNSIGISFYESKEDYTVWTVALSELIRRRCILKEIKDKQGNVIAIEDNRWFRFHDSGDIQSALHMEAINQIAINNPNVQFDDVKIYPTAVCRSHSDKLILTSKIAEWYDNGEFKPYAEENIDELIEVIKYYLVNLKPWVRVQRCIRDIPACSIEAGYQKKGNLRQVIQERIEGLKEKTYDIRQMEVRESKYLSYPAKLVVLKYEASEGIEYHLMMAAFEDKFIDKIKYILHYIYFYLFSFFTYNTEKPYWNNIENYVAKFGFLRLRLDSNPGGDIIKEINNTALIREVHVYGNTLGVGSDSISSQHRGYGKYLVKIAEEIALDNGYKKTSVIAGVGTREYYNKKCGYHLEGTYMIKNLNDNQFNNFIIRISIFTMFVSLYCYFLI